MYRIIILCIVGYLLVGCTQNPPHQEIGDLRPQTIRLRRNGVTQGTVTTLSNQWAVGLVSVKQDTYFDVNGIEQEQLMACLSIGREGSGDASISVVLPVGGHFVADTIYTISEIESAGLLGGKAEVVFDALPAESNVPPMSSNAIEEGGTILLGQSWVMRVKHIREGDYTDASGITQHGLLAEVRIHNYRNPDESYTVEVPSNGTFNADTTYTLTDIQRDPTNLTRGWVVGKEES